jgi:hypothetical protein
MLPLATACKFLQPIHYCQALLFEEPNGARSLKFNLPAPGDEPFLEVALSARVVAIVTGNKRHFLKRNYEGVRILSPAEFLNTFGAEP